MRRSILAFIAGLVSLSLATEDNDKPGSCGRLRREICDCAPHGPDDCHDECRDDSECYGQRKCCTYMCKQICIHPSIRPPHPCPPNQDFDLCPSTKPPTCAQPDGNITAPVECIAGCTCRPGYVLAPDGRCVLRSLCPLPPPPPLPVCPGLHEIYHSCYRGCQPSCANPNADGCIGDYCVRGCFCAPGFVRNAHGRCIRPTSCPPPLPPPPPPPPPTPACPPDQEFHACRRECEATCNNPNPKGCYRRCQVGCFCRPPLVRDHLGNCVNVETCVVSSTIPPICLGANEVYVVCSKKCQSTCDNPKGDNCYSRCVSGCFCKEGYVRDDTGYCIPIEQCPPPPPPPPPPTPAIPVCESDYEEYHACHKGCQKTCENPTGEGCSMDECVTGCFCLPGLVRHPNGHCVRPTQCPTLGCATHEHFEECGPSCPATCPNVTGSDITGTGNGPGPNVGGVDGIDGNAIDITTRSPDQTTSCDQLPCISGCFCDYGFIRNKTDGMCVPWDQCRTYQIRLVCTAYEDPLPCGNLCERECAQGWNNPACPSSCRPRCCRKRFTA